MNPNEYYFIALGVIGCLPIDYDYVNETDITACYGDETGVISIGASGGFGGPYEYSIDNGYTYQSNSNFTDLPAGTYNITVKDAENCVESGPEVVLTQPTQIAITEVDSSNVLCNGDNTGSINVTATGGTGSLYYSVDNGTTFPNSVGTPIALTAGVYDVVVKDANSCEMAGPQVTIEEPEALGIGSVDQTNVLCNGASTGELVIHATGGVKPYQFSIDGTNYQTDSTFTLLPADTYTPYVTDANGCLFTGTDVTITEPIAVTVETEQTNVTCNGNGDGTITITATGDTGPYTYSIDGATYQSETVFSGLAPDTYPIFVEDANGCTWTTTDVTITQPDVLALSDVTATDILCNGETNGTITITATGGTTPYQYSIDDGTTYQAEATFSGLPATTYPIRVKDANGCEVGGTDAVINEPTELVVLDVESTNLFCNGDNSGTIFISTAGGTKPYEFTVDGAFYQSDSLFEGLEAGEYNLGVLDASGCFVSGGTVTLTQPEAMVLDVDQSDVLCNGGATGSITIAATNGLAPYEYSIDGGTTYQSESQFDGLEAGVYPIDVTDANGCAKSATDVEITEPAALTATFTQTDVLCNGKENGSITINAEGGTEPYLYSVDGGESYRTMATAFFLGAGTYPIQVRDANGCVFSGIEATVNEPEALLIDTVLVNDLLCYNEGTGDFTVKAVGGSKPYGFAINDGSYQTDSLFTDLGIGTYAISVVDLKGCEATGEATVSQPDTLVIDTVIHGDVTCFEFNDGTIAIAAEGGTTEYQYSIDGGVTFLPDSLFTGLVPDTYPVTVRDANGCEATDDDVTITQPELLVIDSVRYTDVLCYGESTGTISLGVTGGTEPYNYSADEGTTTQTDSTLTGLTTGTYVATVIDDNGCIVDSADIFIDEPDELTIVMNNSQDITDSSSGLIVTTAAGGTTPYTYTLQPDGTEQDNGTFSFPEPGDAGTYTVEVVDAAGCGPVATNEVTIANLTDIQLTESGAMEYNIYPNPSGGRVTIEFLTEKEEMTMDICSIDGKILMKRKIRSSAGKVIETLDLSDLAKGIYMIRIDHTTLPNGIILQ